MYVQQEFQWGMEGGHQLCNFWGLGEESQEMGVPPFLNVYVFQKIRIFPWNFFWILFLGDTCQHSQPPPGHRRLRVRCLLIYAIKHIAKMAVKAGKLYQFKTLSIIGGNRKHHYIISWWWRHHSGIIGHICQTVLPFAQRIIEQVRFITWWMT